MIRTGSSIALMYAIRSIICVLLFVLRDFARGVAAGYAIHAHVLFCSGVGKETAFFF